MVVEMCPGNKKHVSFAYTFFINVVSFIYFDFKL